MEHSDEAIRRIFIGRFRCILIALNLDRYNSPFKTRAQSMIRWTMRPRDPLAIFTALLIQRISFGHVACIQKLEWNIVPHGKNKKERDGFIRCDENRGLANSDNRNAYM